MASEANHSATAAASEEPVSTTLASRPRKPASPIVSVRHELQSLLERVTASDAPQALTPALMRDLLKKVVDAGDRELFVKMLEVIPGSILMQLDPDASLLSYCIVKMAEGVSGPADGLVSTLARLDHFDQFLCDLIVGRIIEESDESALHDFMGLMGNKKWPFQVDRGLQEQLIVEVYAPNRNWPAIKQLFSEYGGWSYDCYDVVLLSLVNPDPTEPLHPQWAQLPPFLQGCQRSKQLAAALEHLFEVHLPPDHILEKLANLPE